MEHFAKAVENYLLAVREDLNRLERAPIPSNHVVFFGNQFRDWVEPHEIKKLGEKQTYVYIIREGGTVPFDEIKHALETRSKNCNVSRWIGGKDYYNKFNVLYVGQSRNLNKRLKEHFSGGNLATYGMHLGEWLKTELRITVEYFCVDCEVSQAIEDALWDYYRPIFGRKGMR